jgi:hypothetical protein
MAEITFFCVFQPFNIHIYYVMMYTHFVTIYNTIKVFNLIQVMLYSIKYTISKINEENIKCYTQYSTQSA